MGQCMSRKAATAFAASAVVVHQQAMPRHQKLKESPEDENRGPIKKQGNLTKGVATSFGFRRRPATSAAPSVAGNPSAAKRLANASSESIDNNGNAGCDDTEPLTTNVASSGRSTPHRLPPPKKEAAGTKISRFGFRQSNANRLNKIADINTNPPVVMEYSNNNIEAEKFEAAIKAKVEMHNKQIDSNKNRQIRSNIPAVNKFTLQSTQLPKPQPIMLMESKTAKTLANNNKKQCGFPSGDESSSMTEDSGVGSHYGDNIQQLERSPIFRRSRMKPRNLEVIVTGKTFDVRDLDESLENSLSLPPLPSAFQRHNNGYVHDRTLEYQRNIDKNKIDNERLRRNSLTSSEASSQYEEEKTYRDKQRSEKIPKSFLKSRVLEHDSSPHSSDDQMWSNAGEAMADDFSCSFSSSDESKDRDPIPSKITTKSIGSALQNLMTASINLHNATPKTEIRNVILSIEDPKFAAVAAASNCSNLIEDETSPVDSITCSYSDASEILVKKMNKSSSNSKDINEKLTISSPGSPTNASNSLSLSEGREDFLIDDEIADQPALMFDDTITNTSGTVSNQTSEATPTLVDSTPKPKRRILGSFDGSPLVLRNKKLLSSRTGSLDTLSPCESIASDDCIMDFDLSHSSGVEDSVDRTEQNSCNFSLDDIKIRTVDFKSNDIMRDWSSLLSTCDTRDGSKKLSSRPSRLLRSRTGTPSSIPDSPRSLEGLRTSKTSLSQSPLRLSSRSSGTTGGYDSDDSAIKVDRSQHCAMQQDVMSIKTMLLKLKRVLHESETRNSLENGFFNGFSSDCDKDLEDQESSGREELTNLRRQVLFLQGQLEDKDRTVQTLQEEMVKLVSEQQNSQSAPASVTSQVTCNAATQTERLRPISAGPSLLQGSPTDASPGSLVSASEIPTRRSRGSSVTPQKSSSKKLWRMPGEPPSPQRYTAATSPSSSSIPRRSCSRSRINHISSTS